MNDLTRYVNINDTYIHCAKYLSPQTTLVWLCLNTYWFNKKDKGERINDYVKPSINSIVAGTGLSKNTIRKCIKELNILGFISKIEKIYDKETGMNRSNLYYMDENPENLIENMVKLKEFRSVKRSKDTISEDGFD